MKKGFFNVLVLASSVFTTSVVNADTGSSILVGYLTIASNLGIIKALKILNPNLSKESLDCVSQTANTKIDEINRQSLLQYLTLEELEQANEFHKTPFAQNVLDTYVNLLSDKLNNAVCKPSSKQCLKNSLAISNVDRNKIKKNLHPNEVFNSMSAHDKQIVSNFFHSSAFKKLYIDKKLELMTRKQDYSVFKPIVNEKILMCGLSSEYLIQ